MVFNSVVFLFCFLPLALLAYYLVPGRGKNVVLLVESLLFYCWTGVEYLPLIVCLIVFNYLWGLLTARTKAKLKGLLPAVAVLVNLAALVYFKYANFLIDTLNRIGNFGLAALDVGAVLPLGISYYIFKIISYEADVYTGKVEAEKDPIAFAAYVLFFPQLIVGLTIVAMGTSLPEAAVSITSALKGSAGITIGNVVGSNIMNVLVILGITAVITNVAIQKSTLYCEIPFMIGITALMIVFGITRRAVSFPEGVIFWILFPGLSFCDVEKE